MADLAARPEYDLPATLEDLSKFVLVGREKLIAVKAEIRAIDKVGLAKAVREQKLQEGQALSEALLDAEVRIGQLMREIPARPGYRRDLQPTDSGVARLNCSEFEGSEKIKTDSGVDFEKAPEISELKVSNPDGSDKRDVGQSITPEIITPLKEETSETKSESREPKTSVKTKADVIKEAGFTPKRAERFQQLAEHPEIVEQAKQEARENDDIVSRSLVLNMIKGEKRKAERQEAITEQLSKPKTSRHIDIFTTDKKYRVIYADPPWSYNDKQDTEKLGGAVKHYPTMSLEEICKLPVPADKNAVLFLWTTSPMLEDAFKVINSWGFKYKSSFIWDKISHVMGHYNSVRHEFLLVCVRGNCTPDVPKLFDSVVSIERTEHSRKPDKFREIIDTIYPIGERLEMFAREAPEGWDVWGNMA